jgi:uracil-DNA glycosylase
VTRRRSSYRSLASLQRDNRVCRACAEAGYPLESRPVFEGSLGQRAMIIGQAPGALEGLERRPWRGRAGVTLRGWLELDEEQFYATFYCCSVTRCYPGKQPSGRGDRAPTGHEIGLCRFWLDWDLRLLRPRVVVPVGGLAIRRVLGLSGLAECIGSTYPFGEAVAVPLPHPSGASGWLNEPENRERVRRAASLVGQELRRAGAASEAARTRTTRTAHR